MSLDIVQKLVAETTVIVLEIYMSLLVEAERLSMFFDRTHLFKAEKLHDGVCFGVLWGETIDK